VTSPQRSVPSSAVPPAGPAAERAAARPVQPRPVPPRCAGPVGRGSRSVAPSTPRRRRGRSGVRPAPTEGLAGGRPLPGSCAARAGRSAVLSRPAGPVRRVGSDEFTPIRLTQRGRRVVAGLSIAVGLSIAAVTVVTVQLGSSGGGLELAGSSTVVVQSGDTLWSLAQELAPEEDPRAVVDAIVELNGLQDVDLLPGAVLQLP
jgi:nucleoid-associated protein YgaU